MTRPNGLREIAGYADAIGPSKSSVDLHTDDSGTRSALIDDAHEAGLEVIVYTFRPENQFLGAFKDRGEEAARNEAGSLREIRQYIEAGIDGFFTDDPALGRQAVDAGK